MPPAAPRLCSVPSCGLSICYLEQHEMFSILFFFFTILPVLPWQQLGNAHFRANGRLLVSHRGEVCGDVLSLEKERTIVQLTVTTDFSERVTHADSTACLNSMFP